MCWSESEIFSGYEIDSKYVLPCPDKGVVVILSSVTKQQVEENKRAEQLNGA